MMLQVYAIDRKGKLAHAGTQEFTGQVPTPEECVRHEQVWRRWRNRYVREHVGSYPLKDERRNGHIHRVVLSDGSTVDLPCVDRKPRAAAPKAAKKYVMLMSSVGNPDFGQYASVSEPAAVSSDTLVGLIRAAEEYIGFWDLGGGNWVDPEIRDTEGRFVARMSYNRRLWAVDGDEILPQD